jgi:hypothetical protein
MTIPPKLARLHASISIAGGLLVGLGIIAGIVRAWQKAMAARPEWSYWEQLAMHPWQDVAGADKDIFGYLPGFAAVVKPFFLAPHPLGLLAFLSLNAVCSIGMVLILRRYFWPVGERIHPAMLLMTGICIFLALQNNQVVVPSMYLTLVGFFAIMANRLLGSIALAIAVLVKTLPATLFLLLALIERFRLAVIAGIMLVVLSVSLSTLTDGWQTSFDAHLDFVEQVSAQNPNRTLTDSEAPRSIGNNTSLSAAIVQLAPALGPVVPRLLNLAIFLGTLALVCYLSFVSSRRLGNAPLVLALWLCWTILAAPFGRYYYLVFLLPAWWLLWPKNPAGGYSKSLLAGLWFVALLPLASRSGAVFLTLVVVTFTACTWRVFRQLQEAADQEPST